MRSSPKNGRPASGPADQPRQNADIEQQVMRLGAMTVAELRTAWRATFGSEPPGALSKDLLARALSFHLQELTFGGLNASTARLLRSLLRPGAEPPRQVKVGSVIVREHKGVVHEVMVTPDGFCWRGQTYDSLSTIAKKITGTTWNGPRFFGLRSKQAPAPGDAAALDRGQAPAARNERAGRRSSLRSGLLPSSGDGA